MPCRYYTEAEELVLVQDGARQLRQQLDASTAAACDLWKAIQTVQLEPGVISKIHSSISDSTRSWLVDHLDRDRIRLENAKASALAKLTPDEKEALGIKD